MSNWTSLQNSPSNAKDNILKISIKSEKTFNNNEKAELSNEKKDTVSTSSYKFLSWREKDRRRRFRDEWKHMWLVIPHGNFEVMCLICHKVMTQRKLDTIKRHTVRRHTEILDMDQSERIVLFEKLFLEHNSQKSQQKNGSSNGMLDNTIENRKPDSEVIDLEKLLSSDCVSATSSSSLSPSESQHYNTDLNFFPKRGKYSRKNDKIKSNQKSDLEKMVTLKSVLENKTIGNKGSYKVSNKGLGDTKPFNAWSVANSGERLMSSANNKNLHDSLFSKFNGSSCPNFVPPLPVMSKCPLCLEECSQNGSDASNAFTRIMSHIQQKHSDKIPNPIQSFDLNHFGGATASDLLKSQSLLLPPTTTNSNYMSISNTISNANLISLLYYQELIRQNVLSNHNQQLYAPVSSDSIYYQPAPSSTNSPMFPMFSSTSPQCSIRPSSSIPSAFILPTIPEPPRLEKHEPILSGYDDNSSNFDKFSPFKRAKFSAESFISEANKQSAFYNPKFNRLDEKDVNFNLMPKLPLGLSTYSAAAELSNSKCKNHKMLNEECSANDSSQSAIKVSGRKSQPDPNKERCLTPKSSAQGNLTCHALRFGPCQDLKIGILEYVKRKKISAAFVMTCCGSISQVKLRMADSDVPNVSNEIRNLNKHFEIVSLVGTIFEYGCHLHISLSDSNGDVIGGHVVGQLIVHSTAEVMIGQICGVRMHREIDESTGCRELSFMSVDSI